MDKSSTVTDHATGIQSPVQGVKLARRLQFLKPYTRIYLAIGVLLLLMTLIFCKNMLVENQHYKEGIQNITAKNYDEAEADFRLCLQDNPDHRKAKGMLAYAILRSELVKRGDATNLRDTLLGKFTIYSTYIMAKELGPKIQNRDTKTWFTVHINDAEKDIKDILKQKNIPFRDWDEFRLAMVDASNEVFSIRKSESMAGDDPMDQACKDMAAAVLARTGRKDACEYLIERCASDNSLILLVLIAGQPMQAKLEKEAGSKSSFIADESNSVLRLIKLVPTIRNFVASHPNLRAIRDSDFQTSQKLLYSKYIEPKNQFWYSNTNSTDAYLPFGSLQNLLAMIDVGESSKVDPTNINIREVQLEDKGYLMAIGGFDNAVQRYVCQAYTWVDGDWQRLKLDTSKGSVTDNEWRDRYLVARDINYTDGKFDVSFGECRKVQRDRNQMRTRPVMRMRQEYRYDARRRYNSYSKQWEGGYAYDNVPYTEMETYNETTHFEEDAAGMLWRKYRLDKGNRALFFETEEWREN